MAGERARGTPQSAYLHPSVEHGDGRGRPHKRVSVGFSFKYPAAWKRTRFTPLVKQPVNG